jgi:hypothetical protein
MNTTGVLFGLFTAVAIGLGFVWVIKLEYYVGAHVARAVAALGVAVTLLSLFVPSFLLSAILGVLGGTIIWGAIELPKQAVRVAQGRFPTNPSKPTKHEAMPPVVDETEGSES